MCFVFFFKQKTAYEMRISDWSSDVCSSDLVADVAHHLVDAKDFLDDEDARSPLGRSLACGRLGQIAGEAAAVMGLDVDAAGHGILLFAYTMPQGGGTLAAARRGNQPPTGGKIGRAHV